MQGQLHSARLYDPRGGCAHCRGARLSWASGVFTSVEDDAPSAGGAGFIMPPLANAHDHTRGVRPTALGAYDLPLELWQLNMTGYPPVDPYLVAVAALGRQAEGGTGTVMVHYTRPQDRKRVFDELKIVARAAEDLGVRVALAAALRDRYPIGYAPNEKLLALVDPAEREAVRAKLVIPYDTPEGHVKLVEDLAAAIDSPLVTVQYGPYGAEWCSDALLRLIAERSAATGRRVHMHLLESKLQREFLDFEHARIGGPVKYLDSIGLLSPRLSVAHAVWLRPDEMELLAERGVTVSTNASSNLGIRSGIAPVREMHRRGVPLAMGLDGFTVDDDDDAFRELRLNYLLHRGVALEHGVPVAEIFRYACYGGRNSVTGRAEGAGIAAGEPADFVELDWDAIAWDLIDAEPGEPALVATRATSRHMRRMVIAGREVVRDGRVLGVDLDEVHRELLAQVKAGRTSYLEWQQTARRVREKMRAFYSAGLHACG